MLCGLAESNEHGISYHEMLVLYTIRGYGYCAQKQMCSSYRLLEQTINNVIAAMRKNEIVGQNESNSKGREKAFTPTEKGKAYAEPFLKSLDTVEKRGLRFLRS